MAVGTAADVRQFLDTMAALKSGETSRALWILDAKVAAGVASVCNDDRWLESLENVRESCSAAAEYYAMYPPDTPEPYQVEMIRALASAFPEE